VGITPTTMIFATGHVQQSLTNVGAAFSIASGLPQPLQSQFSTDYDGIGGGTRVRFDIATALVADAYVRFYIIIGL